jgi:hypothetical protein
MVGSLVVVGTVLDTALVMCALLKLGTALGNELGSINALGLELGEELGSLLLGPTLSK